MSKRLCGLPLLFSAFLHFGCVKDKEPDYGFVDLRNTSWEIKGNFNGTNTTVLLKFKDRGECNFGSVSANWIQSGNEVMWLTADNKRFEARLKSSFEMRGDFYERDGQLPIGSFTGKRKD
jgi:hypothetical protein